MTRAEIYERGAGPSIRSNRQVCPRRGRAAESLIVGDGCATFVLVTGAGATSVLWNPVVVELVLRGHRALPVELPGHGFDTVFPAGYQGPQDLGMLAGAASPIAGLSLDDYTERTIEVVRRVAAHGPVVLVGHSMGGSTVTRVANAVPELLERMVYLCAYCCVNEPVVPAYAPRVPVPGSPLARAREVAFVGDPRQTGVSRTNPLSGDPEVLAAQQALVGAELDTVQVPAVLAYATQPDEPARRARPRAGRPGHVGCRAAQLHPHQRRRGRAPRGAGPHDRRC